MPRIRCHYVDCVFIDDGFCSAPKVELDPDEGCFTFRLAGASDDDDDWTDDDDLLEQEWDEVNLEEEDDASWADDDEDD